MSSAQPPPHWHSEEPPYNRAAPTHRYPPPAAGPSSTYHPADPAHFGREGGLPSHHPPPFAAYPYSSASGGGRWPITRHPATRPLSSYPYPVGVVHTSPGQRANTYAKKACTRCRKSKVACNDTRPCDRCVRAGVESECIDIVATGPVIYIGRCNRYFATPRSFWYRVLLRRRTADLLIPANYPNLQPLPFPRRVWNTSGPWPHPAPSHQRRICALPIPTHYIQPNLYARAAARGCRSTVLILS
ncbi:hypothetical protein IWQ60_000847 [Tieghemiomyces parasiticus]|uniref:Zn(2)-C6 fungal-type domain-containing protein n=1 Tax=Tieghemiomyces parasiticus TaxID=78921 RepID=A0A9W8AKE3_9FUNG|nr:hypothetical protein IWQ60_000847 [Tieghemiomyces parasiticus]